MRKKNSRKKSIGSFWRLLGISGIFVCIMLFWTICSTGIRVSELQFITVEALKTGKVQIHLKGKDRTILLPKKLIRKLRKYIQNYGIRKGPVFQTRTGNPLDRSNICHEMKRICEEAGVDPGKVFPTQSQASLCQMLLCSGTQPGAFGGYSGTFLDRDDTDLCGRRDQNP